LKPWIARIVPRTSKLGTPMPAKTRRHRPHFGIHRVIRIRAIEFCVSPPAVSSKVRKTPKEAVRNGRLRLPFRFVGKFDFQFLTARHSITFSNMRKPPRSRRKLSDAITRTAITAYFTEQEKEEIASAAEAQGISLSAFVAAAALKDAGERPHLGPRLAPPTERVRRYPGTQ